MMKPISAVIQRVSVMKSTKKVHVYQQIGLPMRHSIQAKCEQRCIVINLIKQFPRELPVHPLAKASKWGLVFKLSVQALFTYLM